MTWREAVAVAKVASVACVVSVVAGVAVVAGAPGAVRAEPGPWRPPPEILVLHPDLGPTIDRAERDRFGLFPDLKNYREGRFVRGADGRFRLEYADAGDAAFEHRLLVSDESFELTRRHVEYAARGDALRADDARDADLNVRVLHRMALRYGLDRRWDLAIPLLEELRRDHPARFDDLGLPAMLEDAHRLRDASSPLYLSGSLLDQGGRLETLLFSGYYGLWLGFGVPIALDADSPEAFSLALLTIPPATFVAAYGLTKHRRITDAQADLIRFGGHWGTWQGIGWAAIADAQARGVVGIGVLSGLGAVAGGAAAGRRWELTEGQVALVDAGMGWGAWLGFLAAQMADWDQDDDLLTAALVGSDVGVAVGGLWAARSRLTERRVRFMNLGGVLGGTAGVGIVGLSGIDEERAAFGVLAVGSVAGAWLALAWSRPDDPGTGGGLGAAGGGGGGGKLDAFGRLGIAPFVDVAPGLDGRAVSRVGLRIGGAGTGR